MKLRLSILLFFLTLISCAREPDLPLRVGANVWPGYEGLFLARSLGYYRDTPIQLIDFPSAREVIRALRDGAIEMGAVTADEVLLLAESSQNPRVILVMDFSNGADVILARPPIKTMSDLKGRRVGVEPNALGTYMLARALETSGISVRDIEVVPAMLEEHERVFLSRRVEAIVTFEPRRSRLIKAGAVQIFDSSQIPGEIIDLLVVREDSLDRHKRAIESLLRGWFGALDHMAQNPDDAARLMALREKVTPQEFQLSLKGIRLPDREENLRLLGDGEDNLAQRLERLSRVMLKNKLLHDEVETDKLIVSSFVKQVGQ
jgi:NitT/TauT family transport system substrate-binding protein